MTSPARFTEEREQLHGKSRHTQVQVPTLPFAVGSWPMGFTLGISFSSVKLAYSEHASAHRFILSPKRSKHRKCCACYDA